MALDDENDRTLFVGNLNDSITEELLWELFLQAGPLQKIKIPADKDGRGRKGFGFVTFKHSVSVPYAIELMGSISLFGRQLRLQCRSGSSHQRSMNTPDQFSSGAFHRSQSAPNMQFASPMPMLNLMHAMSPSMFHGQGIMPPPLMMPTRSFESPSNSPTPDSRSKSDSRDLKVQDSDRHRHNHHHRFDPISDNSWKRSRSLASQANLNPHRQHMHPSSRWNQKRH